jgi:hypothetical protein
MTDVLRRAKTPRPATLPAEEPHRILSTAQKYNQGKEWEEPRDRPIHFWCTWALQHSGKDDDPNQ